MCNSLQAIRRRTAWTPMSQREGSGLQLVCQALTTRVARDIISDKGVATPSLGNSTSRMILKHTSQEDLEYGNKQVDVGQDKMKGDTMTRSSSKIKIKTPLVFWAQCSHLPYISRSLLPTSLLYHKNIRTTIKMGWMTEYPTPRRISKGTKMHFKAFCWPVLSGHVVDKLDVWEVRFSKHMGS